MEITFESDVCAVFDDVLPLDQMGAIFEYFRTSDFKLVHESRGNMPRAFQNGYKRAWRFDEGNALTAASGFAAFGMTPEQVPPAMAKVAQKWADERQTKFYPSGTALDPFLGALRQLAIERLSPWVGRAGVDWLAVTATPYIHPPGVGMSWHADEVLYTGAFSYFVHPEWDAEFGGEFLVYDGAIKKKVTSGWNNRKFDPLAVRMAQEVGHTGGRFIEPLPNRMIVIRRGIMHKVAKVSPLAGSHVRASVTGFFLDAAVAPQVMGG